MASLATATTASAAPTELSVQGTLRSAAGGPVADGKYAMGFALYADAKGGKPLWSEKFLGIPLKSGVFAVELGAEDGNKLDDSILQDAKGKAAARWIGVAVGGDPELKRMALRPLLYAVHARMATMAAGLSCSGCLMASHLANASVTASHVSFTYAGSKTKGGPANVALLAEQAKLALHAKQADQAITAESAKLADKATTLACTGCVTAVMTDAKLVQDLVATKKLAKVAMSGKYVDLTGGPDLSPFGRLDKAQQWQAKQTFNKGLIAGADVNFAGHQALAFRFQNGTKAPMPCSAKTVGMVWYDAANNTLQVCNGSKYRVFAFAAPLGGKGNPGTSCADILASEGKVPSGQYWIDPDGKGGTNPWEVLCDMTTAGGGWTPWMKMTNGGAYKGLQGVPNSQEWVDNGTFTFSKTLLKNSKRMVLIKETVAPFRVHMYDFKQHTNPTGENFVGTLTGDRGATVAVWNWATQKWQSSGNGKCNGNNHSQWNCTPPSGIRWHYATRDWTGDGGGHSNSGWTWFTGYNEGYGNLSQLVANWNKAANKTAHINYIR